MEAIIRETRFGMSYDCDMVESVAKLNKSKSAKLALYAYYEDKDLAQDLKDMQLGKAGDIIVCKSDLYFWLLEDSKILNISMQYLERYIRVKIEVSYSKAIGTTSMQLIKRNAALKKILE